MYLLVNDLVLERTALAVPVPSGSGGPRSCTDTDAGNMTTKYHAATLPATGSGSA